MTSSDPTSQFVMHLGKAQGRVYAFILSLVHNWNEADEISQETNLVLWRKFSEFRQGTDFVRWACQVAYYEVLKHRERSGKREVLLADDLLETLAVEAIAETDAFDGKRQALARCLEGLPAADRQLVELRYSDEATTESVATRVGRSVAAVYKALNRIRWGLLECVRRRLAAEGVG